MGELRLTGLDEQVLATLSRRAAVHGRTVEAEASAILEQETTKPLQTVWDKMRESAHQTGRLTVSTIDLIREDRDARSADPCG